MFILGSRSWSIGTASVPLTVQSNLGLVTAAGTTSAQYHWYSSLAARYWNLIDDPLLLSISVILTAQRDYCEF